jgi:uncharacterized protein
MILRVVFDTSTVISALLFKHRQLAWLRSHWQNGLCQPLLSRDTALELTRVLLYPKFRRIPTSPDEALADYVPFCELVTIERHNPIKCRDPKDQIFLDLAFSSNANMLVSSDQDLLCLAGQTGFLIESPETYRQRFQE